MENMAEIGWDVEDRMQKFKMHLISAPKGKIEWRRGDM